MCLFENTAGRLQDPYEMAYRVVDRLEEMHASLAGTPEGFAKRSLEECYLREAQTLIQVRENVFTKDVCA